ncbi:MAG: histidine phosphatase family protein [Flavobacteriaceae bacterium]|nr:histidine phosphatase family protein [Flavobacteriaceae bacterium]
MKRLFLFMLVFRLSIPSFSQEKIAVSTYFLIRHAEKNRSNPENKNPHLNAKGFERALRWSQVFKDIKLDFVYASDYNRTIETANPTAASHHLKVNKYHPINIDYKEFISKTKGKTVLIVGHNDSIPNFVNALIGKEKYTQIADSNNANLYIVTIIDGKSSDLRLYIK